MRFQNILTSVLFFLLGLPGVVYAQKAQDITLENGMKVIVLEDSRSPVVVNMLWYKAGSMDETSGITGVAHVLEHMMFKGTQAYGQGEFSRIVASLGGRENAFTSRDCTAYFQHIRSSELERMMALEADRMQNLLLTPEAFSKEIKVVMEERRLRTEDKPAALLDEAVYATAFSAHPYHWPIVGWMNDLKNMTVTDAKNWYLRWYAPNNATMVVVGDVSAPVVFDLARKYFGAIPVKDVVPSRAQIEPAQKGLRRVTVKAPAENPMVVLAFKAPSLRDVENDEDVYALDVLAAILNGYDNARLPARLVRKDKVAASVAVDYAVPSRGPALFMLEAISVGKVSTADLERRLREEIARIAREGISPAELERVKTQLVASQIYKRDSLLGQALEIGMLEMTGIGYQNKDRLIEKLKEVSVDKIQSVAARYFGEDALTVGTLIPLPLNVQTQ